MASSGKLEITHGTQKPLGTIGIPIENLVTKPNKKLKRVNRVEEAKCEAEMNMSTREAIEKLKAAQQETTVGFTGKIGETMKHGNRMEQNGHIKGQTKFGKIF